MGYPDWWLKPNNSTIAYETGISRPQVSRVRRGEKIFSEPSRKIIAERYGWSMLDQAQSIIQGTYARDLNRALAKGR